MTQSWPQLHLSSDKDILQAKTFGEKDPRYQQLFHVMMQGYMTYEHFMEITPEQAELYIDLFFKNRHEALEASVNSTTFQVAKRRIELARRAEEFTEMLPSSFVKKQRELKRTNEDIFMQCSLTNTAREVYLGNLSAANKDFHEQSS